MSAVKRPLFRDMLCPIVREHFDLGLRNDLKVKEGKKQICGWKDLRTVNWAEPANS
jgi:hypothetical protein